MESRYRLVLLFGSLVMLIALGIRHGFGLFLQPMSADLGWGREVFSIAIAMQNIVWGLAQPFSGMLADRFGAGKIVLAGALLYAAGLWLMSASGSPAELYFSAGLLIGLGLSGTTFSIVYGVIGRAASPEKRIMALGIAGAAASFGQFVMVPGSQALIGWGGWAFALAALAGMAFLMAPFSAALMESPHAHAGPQQTLGEALREARAQRSFWLLLLGYFTCGFQVVFIGSHLPAYLVDRGLSPRDGMMALALVGLFNIAGSFGAGWFGSRYSKKNLLALIYFGRTVAIVALLMLPLTPLTAAAFGVAMGFLWLGTVPLTNGIVAQIFGVRHLAMLSGFVFFSHQFGSFVGVWAGGWLFDRTGSYDIVWIIAAALGVIAGLVNLPIDERPLSRLRPSPAGGSSGSSA
ncbi:MAG TPA: MFS transporter [Burkholderiales bacterium]|jgi:MFS family permease|nr:MFS transporter [Burkholderiales bacterium]